MQNTCPGLCIEDRYSRPGVLHIETFGRRIRFFIRLGPTAVQCLQHFHVRRPAIENRCAVAIEPCGIGRHGNFCQPPYGRLQTGAVAFQKCNRPVHVEIPAEIAIPVHRFVCQPQQRNCLIRLTGVGPHLTFMGVQYLVMRPVVMAPDTDKLSHFQLAACLCQRPPATVHILIERFQIEREHRA